MESVGEEVTVTKTESSKRWDILTSQRSGSSNILRSEMLYIFNRIFMTRFQLILPVADHNVTKNLMGHRIHVPGPQIYQINRQTNSFQNMCDMLYVKIDRLARKNTSKSAIFVCTNMGFLNLEGPLRETVYTRSTSGLPLKTWVYDCSN